MVMHRLCGNELDSAARAVTSSRLAHQTGMNCSVGRFKKTDSI